MTQLTSLALAVSAILAPAPFPKSLRATDYQRVAEATRWREPVKDALARCLAEQAAGYRATRVLRSGAARISLCSPRGGKPVYAFTGHGATVFLIRNDVLYYADYGRISSGCVVVAVDLKSGKQLWQRNLKGVGPVCHSEYYNAVRMEGAQWRGHCRLRQGIGGAVRRDHPA